MYDYLIVGSGLYGSVFAHEATKAGKKCLVLEKKEHIGGNIYTKNVDGIKEAPKIAVSFLSSCRREAITIFFVFT